MKFVKLTLTGAIITSFMIVSYLRSYYSEEDFINYMTGNEGHEASQKRNLVSSDLMTSTCSDQEDLASQPYQQDFKRAVQNMENLRGSNRALDAMNTNQDWNSYLSSLPQVYVGLLVAGVIAFIIFFVQILQIFCQSCISCFKRDTEKEPYAMWSIYCSIISAIVGTIIVFGFCIAGISTNKVLIQSMNRGICQSLNMTNHLVSGFTAQKWEGINNIQTQLRNIGTELQNTYTVYNTAFSSASFIGTVSTLQQDITTIAGLGGSANQVPLPNPNRVVPKLVLPDILFILGSTAVLDQTKVAGSLEYEYQTQTALQADLLAKLRDSSQALYQNAASVQAAFNTGSVTVGTFNTKILNFKSLVDTQMKNSNNAALFVYNAGNAVYGISMAFGLLGLLSITLILWCRLSFVKYGIYISWFIISIMSMLAFAAAAIGYTQAVGLMENCEGIKLLYTDATQFDTLINFIGTPELKTCFFGDGNLSEQFGLDNQFLMINEVNNDLSNLNNNTALFTASLSSRVIYSWQTQLNNYITYTNQAVQLSSASGFLQYDLPSQTLDTLNSWSNYDYTPLDGSQNAQFSLSCGAFSRDTIVYYQSLCPTSSTLCQNVLPINQPCCIPLNNNVYNLLFIRTRLNLITSSCANLSTYQSNYMSFYQALLNYVTTLNTALTSNVQPAFNTYQTDSNNYLTQANTLFSSITTTFQTQTQTLRSMVTDSTTGIQNVLQCNFLITDFQNMYQGLCQSYMVRMYNSSVILIVVSCFSLAAQVAYFFTTTRIIDYIERNRVHQLLYSRQKPIIDPEKYRSHPLNDNTNNQSYLDQSNIQPALLQNESILYLNHDQSISQLPQEIELNKMNNAQPVKQGLLEDFQKRNNGTIANGKQNNLNPLPAPSQAVPANGGEKPALYQPKFQQKQDIGNRQNTNPQNGKPQSANITTSVKPPSNSKFNNNFDDKDDEDEDEEGLKKLMQNNNSKFGIPVGNNVIR